MLQFLKWPLGAGVRREKYTIDSFGEKFDYKNQFNVFIHYVKEFSMTCLLVQHMLSAGRLGG